MLKGLTDRRVRREQVSAVLELTNLQDVRNKAVSTYSGGMKQRFGIAQALLGDPRLIIVDEPTAGLDPEERNRFHNLLSEIGENAVVLLSTHIVEDVRDLCPTMAILAGGRVVREGEPARLVGELDGRLWRKTVAKSDVPAHRESHAVISTRLFGGRTQLHVLSDDPPGPGFERMARSEAGERSDVPSAASPSPRWNRAKRNCSCALEINPPSGFPLRGNVQSSGAKTAWSPTTLWLPASG